MNFSQKVYSIVKTIPAGKVTTYKHIGILLNSKAFQAIGQVLKHNPDIKNIPCHRVVKSNRLIGGYLGHIDDEISKNKEKLLLNEGVLIENGKVNKNCVIL